MNRIKNICVSVLLSLGLFFSLQSVGFCAETYTLTADQLQTLEINLNQLQENNKMLKNLLNQSNQDLMIASEESDNLNNQITMLKNQLMESQNQIEILKSTLMMLKQQTAEAQTSLKIANEELQSARESFKTYQKQQEKIESRLRMQKNIWQVLSGLAIGYAVSK